MKLPTKKRTVVVSAIAVGIWMVLGVLTWRWWVGLQQSSYETAIGQGCLRQAEQLATKEAGFTTPPTEEFNNDPKSYSYKVTDYFLDCVEENGITNYREGAEYPEITG